MFVMEKILLKETLIKSVRIEPVEMRPIQFRKLAKTSTGSARTARINQRLPKTIDGRNEIFGCCQLPIVCRRRVWCYTTQDNPG